jgi:hypothetical protein
MPDAVFKVYTLALNADVNAACNILRKVIGKFDYDPIEWQGIEKTFLRKHEGKLLFAKASGRWRVCLYDCFL